MNEDKPTVYIQNNAPASVRSNGLGVAGFVVSLVGFLFCAGILCPIGLILSACGMRKQPRGLAIAGLVLGLIGSVVPILLIAGFGMSAVGAAGLACANCVGMGALFSQAMATGAKTQIGIENAKARIELYAATHAGVLPADADGTAEIATERDGWFHALHYTKKDEIRFEIRSAGLDGEFGNSDDVVKTFPEADSTQPK